jgi:hypothetical protein
VTPLELLVCAISRQENNPGTNPGNLRVAGQAGLVPGQNYGDLAVFVSRAAGVLALYRDLLAKAAQGMTIRQMIHLYCPSGDGANDPETYCRNVAEWTGLAMDVPFVQLLPAIAW